MAALLCLASLPAGPARAQPPAHAYRLEARLDAETHRVEGRALIRWTNGSDAPIDALLWHLYLNAFADRGTIFMRETGGSLRGERFSGPGSIEVHELRLESGEDLLEGADFELEPGDRTQLRTPLPRPIAPGQSVQIEARFTSILPPLFARSGHAMGLHVVAQWFPKLARLEPDGRWADFPYAAHTEFYADFARYELSLDLPSGWPVGATGDLVSDREQGDRHLVEFRADPVHDAAFVTAPWLLERVAVRGELRLRILYPPGYGRAAGHHEAIALRALSSFESLYGPYPYRTLTIIVPPRAARGGAAMEYPMLLLTSGPWFRVPGVRFVHEDVTVHELAHQWFQGMIASDEARWPMLDEGLATWAAMDHLRQVHGRDASGVGLGPIRLDSFELLRLFALRPGDPAPLSAARSFSRGASYGRSVYGRSALTLESVARTWGRDRLHQALGRYARRHRFGHPEPADLFESFDAIYGPGFSARVLEPSLAEGALAELSLQAGSPPSRGSALGLPTWIRCDETLTPWPAGQAPPPSPSPRCERTLNPHRSNLLDPVALDETETRGRGFLELAMGLLQLLAGSIGP